MHSILDATLFDGRRASDVLFERFDKGGEELNFVDIGARNGSYLLPHDYAKRTCITGFEPNQVEFDKLVSGNTDARAAGLREFAFKRRQYYPYAVWSGKGRRELQIPRGVGAATLMGKADQRMTTNMWQATPDGGASYYDTHQRPDKAVMVECASLDDMFADERKPLDIVKIDVEGGEVAVLDGAKALLQRQQILFVYSEFQFTPYYEDRVTLGHQQVLLDALGYRLISLNLDHTGYCWKPTKVDPQQDRWLTYAGDAVFVLDPDRADLTHDQLYRLGLASAAFGFNAFGINLIRESGAIGAPEVDAMTEVLNHRSIGRRLQDAWHEVPNVAYRALRRIGLR